MAKYDLTGSLERDFTFSINGEEFVFHKPTVREMRALAKMFALVSKEDDPETQEARSTEAMEKLYEYIENTTSDRHISDVLDEQPMDVQLLFNDMIQKELGAQQ